MSPSRDKKYRHLKYLENRESVLAKAKQAYWEDPVGNARNEAKKRRKRQASTPQKYIWSHVRSRCKGKGQEFSITPEDIHIPDKCPLLGIPLEFGTNRHKDCSPSLDRIDNSKGYIPGNVWVISFAANTMKRDASIPELVSFAKNVLALFGDTKPRKAKASKEATGDCIVSINKHLSKIEDE